MLRIVFEIWELQLKLLSEFDLPPHSLGVAMKILGICRLRNAHVRKQTRLSPLFCTASDKRLGRAWENSPACVLPSVEV